MILYYTSRLKIGQMDHLKTLRSGYALAKVTPTYFHKNRPQFVAEEMAVDWTAELTDAERRGR